MPKNGLYKPPGTEAELAATKAALDKFLNHAKFGGNKNKMASELGFTRNAVSFWFSKGYMGHMAAMKISSDPNSGFTMRDLRPDIQDRIDAKTAELEKIKPPEAKGQLVS